MILAEQFRYVDYEGQVFWLRQKDKYEVGDIVIVKNTPDIQDFQPSSTRPYNTRLVKIKQVIESRGAVNVTDQWKYIPYNDNGSYLYHNAIAGLADDYRPIFPPLPATCSRCGRPFPSSQNTDKDHLCPDCAQREFVLPYHRYYPELIFYTKETETAKKPLFLGVELEVDGAGESDRIVKQIYRKFPELKKYCYFSHDGSLNDGLEIIFHPMDLTIYREIRPLLAMFFDYLRSLGYLSHNTGTCGLHIHINRDFFPTAKKQEVGLSKILYAWEKHWQDILLFSRRISKQKIERYAKKLDEPIRSFISRWDKTNEHDGHYYSVNLTNDNTIEFRIFRGTLNINTFYATLEFIDNLVKISSTKTITELAEMPFDAYLSELSAKYYAVRRGDTMFEEVELT